MQDGRISTRSQTAAARAAGTAEFYSLIPPTRSWRLSRPSSSTSPTSSSPSSASGPFAEAESELSSEDDQLTELFNDFTVYDPELPAAMADAEPPPPQPINSKHEPSTFTGRDHEDADTWLRLFAKYAVYRRMDGPTKLAYFSILLRETAADWLENLDDGQKDTWEHLEEAFRNQYINEEVVRSRNTHLLWNRTQGATESVADFFTTMRKLARNLGLPNEVLRRAIIQGLRTPIRIHVMQSAPDTIDDAYNEARLAEAAQMPTGVDTSISAVLEEVRLHTAEVRALRSAIPTGGRSDVITAAAAGTEQRPSRSSFRRDRRERSQSRDPSSSRSLTPAARETTPPLSNWRSRDQPRDHRESYRRQRDACDICHYERNRPLDDTQRSSQNNFHRPEMYRPPPQQWQPPQPNRRQYNPPSASGNGRLVPARVSWTPGTQQNQRDHPQRNRGGFHGICSRCGIGHEGTCRFQTLTCNNCGRVGHAARVCRTARV